LAVREFSLGKHLVVVYRELEKDGFVITSFLTSNTNSLTGENNYGHSSGGTVSQDHPAVQLAPHNIYGHPTMPKLMCCISISKSPAMPLIAN